MSNDDPENTLYARAREVGTPEMKAIPTLYNGCQFRSRLEARWAAFFDLLGWDWEYEPCDFDGWTPDFVLKTMHHATWVEVKPLAFNGDEQRDKELISRPALDKVRSVIKAGVLCQGEPKYEDDVCDKADEVIVLGLSPFTLEFTNDGAVGYFMLETWGFVFPDPVVLQNPGPGDYCLGRYDFAAQYGSFARRFSGLWDGNRYRSPMHAGSTQELWRLACRRVQWKPAQ